MTIPPIAHPGQGAIPHDVAPANLAPQAVIFDWAGTLVDFGSFAPTQVFVEAFARFGLQITLEQARGPMGMGKWDHIAALCQTPAVHAQYRQRFGQAPQDADITRIYDTFLPLQQEKVAQYSTAIPGAAAVVAQLRDQGLRIGSCSGYPRSVLDRVVAQAGTEGIVCDCTVASDETPRTRPWPAMALQNVIALDISSVAACIKVDDTAVGIAEGLNAGMWTVGLTLSGNAAGLTLAQYQSQDAGQLAEARDRAHAVLAPAGAHYLIDTIADLPPVVADIRLRLARGETPQHAARSA